jgi:hypothetical protein
LFSVNQKVRSFTDRQWQLQYLNKVKDLGKVVMDIDYIKIKSQTFTGDNDLVCKYYDFIEKN